MWFRVGRLFFVVACGAALGACGGSGSGGDSDPDSHSYPPNSLQTTLSASTVSAKADGGHHVLRIVFNSSDEQPLTNLTVDGLTALPDGWSSGASQFGCSTVGMGDGCVLSLTYAPADAASGILSLSYSYTNSAGTVVSDSIEVPYEATSDNTVIATGSPAGQIVAIVGQAPRAVTIGFSTDDGLASSELELTTDIGTLPSSWSVASNELPCATVSVEHACALQLTYTPQAAESGALTLDYSYVDNSGTAKTGSLNIPYAATTSNNVVTNLSSASVNAVAGGVAGQTTVTFTTDDGNPATDLSIISALPSGWSGASAFNCPSLSSGNGCQVTLTYAPTNAGTGVFSLTYSYTDSAGLAKIGSVNVSYSARDPLVYIADANAGVRYCAIDNNGDLSNCVATSAFIRSDGITFFDGKAYVSWGVTGEIQRCDVGPDGDLSNCSVVGPNFSSPLQLATNGNRLYVGTLSSNPVRYCAFSNSLGLVNCTVSSSPNYNPGITIVGQLAYLTSPVSNQVSLCNIDASTGDLSPCVPTASGLATSLSLAIANGRAYVVNYNGSNNVIMCQVDPTTGELSSCVVAATSLSLARDIHIHGDHAYITRGSNVSVCDVISTTGLLQNCRTSLGGATFSSASQIAVY